jgi:hypothetical protein
MCCAMGRACLALHSGVSSQHAAWGLPVVTNTLWHLTALGSWCVLPAEPRPAQVDSIYSEVRGDWEVEANQYQSVAAAALDASTTDNEHQAIGQADVCPSRTSTYHSHSWAARRCITCHHGLPTLCTRVAEHYASAGASAAAAQGAPKDCCACPCQCALCRAYASTYMSCTRRTPCSFLRCRHDHAQ